jgi:hypothetical protein|tara:strand:- start:4973 stop:5812 length:840 start_codon:yes stop_codon:yes gene_type:complete
VTLHNIVRNIQKTIECGESSPSAKDMDDFLDEVREAVTGLFEERRDSKKEIEKSTLRFSSLGKKNRQLWYKAHMKSAESSLPYDTLLKFTYGHLLESLLLLLVKTAGHTVTDQQKEYEIDGVKGHIDCKIDGVIVDAKSASDFGFQKFKKGDLQDDPFGYMQQLGAYVQADNAHEGGFLAFNKVTGEICYMPVTDMEMPDAKERIAEAKEVISKEEPPERCFTPVTAKKDGRQYLRSGCVYCDFKHTCWSDSNQGEGLIEEKGWNDKPKYYTDAVGSVF